MYKTAAILALMSLQAFGQDFKLPASLDRLQSKAKETVDITLDGPLLQAAGKLISNKGEDAKVRALAAGLRGVYIRSYEFEKEGEYSPSDLEAVRSQLKGPGWSRIVGVVSKTEHSEIYLHSDGSKAGGIVILAAEPRELTVVAILGAIDLEQLSDLSGHFGIPEIQLDKKKGNKD